MIENSTAVTVSPDTTICNGAIQQLSVTSTLSNYNTYNWIPATNLYTDAAASIPYVTGVNASTVYVKSTNAGEYVYNVAGYRTSSGCTDTATTTVTILPGSITASASPSSICISGTAVISLDPASGYGAGGIQWQSSTDQTNYNTIPNQTSNTLSTGTISATKYYRAILTDGANNTCTSTDFTMVVNNPQPDIISGAERCGSGSVTLTAQASSGTVKWYEASSGGNPIYTGSSYTTPVLTQTKTYYVSLTVNGCEGERSSVWATITQTAPTFTLSASSQTVTCEEPIAKIYVSSDISSYDTYQWSPATNLYTDAAATIPYVAGASADTVWSKSNSSGTTTYTATANNNTTFCSSIATSSVTTTIANAVTLSVDTARACYNGITAISVTSDPANYDNYAWSPITNLYTDAAATVPYQTNENATTVYVKSSTVGYNTYTVNATVTGGTCVGAAIARVNVLPSTASITSPATTGCRKSIATLTLSTSTTLPAGSIQWQTSANNITFFDSIGQNGVTLNTDTIRYTRYYKALIKDGAGNTCLSPTYTLAVNNPLVDSVTRGFRCGTGTVRLSAVPSSGATIKWYAASTGGTGTTGNSYTTPSITATKVYYAEANIGTCVSLTRTPDTAVIGKADTVILSVRADTLCNGSVATISVTAPTNLSTYETYKWSPATNLYTDAAGTIAYSASASATTIYFKSSTAGSSSYILTANNTTNSCSKTANVSYVVLGTTANTTITSSKPNGICISGKATLTVSSPVTLATGQVQWQMSTDSVNNFVDTVGATSPSFTTPTLTSNRYYRAVIKRVVGGAPCFTTNVFKQIVNNPVIDSTKSAKRCGDGTITLYARAANGGTVNWYDVNTGGIALQLASNTYTPTITDTKKYYVEAVIGTCNSATRDSVTATKESSPTVTLNAKRTVCNGAITQLSVTSPVSDYTDFVWTSTSGAAITDLYTDPAATANTRYVAGANASVLYAKITTVGQTIYNVNANNTTNSCSFSGVKDTLYVQPGGISASISTTLPLCKTGTASMSLSPANNYDASTIQWQTSTDGNINNFINNGTPTATATLTTPTLTSSLYYRAIVKAGTYSWNGGSYVMDGTTVCATTDPMQVTVINPQPTSVSDSTRCGVGGVTLKATAAAGTIKWYKDTTLTAVQSGSSPSSYPTGTITSTKYYFVGVVVGTCEGYRVKDSAVVTPPPSLSVAPTGGVLRTKTVCYGSTTEFSVTSTLSNFDSAYIWSPTTFLYSDASCTRLITGKALQLFILNLH